MANFTPTLAPIHEKSPFRFWCQKVLPTVYDDSLSYYELLTKVVYYLNENTQDLETVNSNVEALYNSYVELQNYVNNYFDQNFPELVEQKLDEMVKDGTFDAMLHAIVDPYFAAKSEEIDDTLDEQNEDIAFLQDAWNNFVNAHAGLTTETVLWEGTAFKRNDEFDFDTEDFTDYNYLDFYYRLNTIDTYAPVITRVSTENLTITGNYPLLSFVYPTNISDITDKGLTNDMFAIARVLDTDNVTPLENKLKIAYAKKWTWTGASNADAAVLMADESAQAQVAGYIIKVVGIKDAQNDMEVVDARVGYNGTIYQSLGQAIRTQVDDLYDSIGTASISEAVITALLNCFQNVAWINGNGATYYNALEAALNNRMLVSISAVYTQSGVVYDTDSLDDLKSDLVVTALYSDNTTEVITSGYTLSGTLTAGTSTITVSYEEKTTTFTVNVTHYTSETMWVQGYANSNATQAKPQYAPFYYAQEYYTYNYPMTVTALELNVLTAGTLTIGHQSNSTLTIGTSQSTIRAGFVTDEVITFTQTGKQKVYLQNPITLTSDNVLAIGSTTDTAIFAYGYGGTDKHFYYCNSTLKRETNQSLGINVYIEGA